MKSFVTFFDPQFRFASRRAYPETPPSPGARRRRSAAGSLAGRGLSFAAAFVALALTACAPAVRPPILVSGPPVERVSVPAASYLDHTRRTEVLTGLDVLEREGFARLRGRKVGLVANHSAVNREGVHLLDLALEHPEVQLVALFSPEHGFKGVENVKVESGIEPTTGLPLHSLYGKTYRPTRRMLDGIETLVFDIQDIGVRYYTYISTMGYCMEEAAKRGIRVVVLDRPNPIGGWWFDGPIQDRDLVGSFTAYLPMPVAHGMTVGELALLFNDYYGIGVDLEVIPVEGWLRETYFDETGLPWHNPSPNIRDLNAEILYPMVGLVEAANVSVGRGTDRPFEYVGAPWIDSEALAAALRARDLPGLWIQPIDFTPYERDITGEAFPSRYPYVGQKCGGVRILVTNRWRVAPVEAGLHLMHALFTLYPDQFELQKLRGLIGAQWVLDMIEQGESPETIIGHWSRSEAFHEFALAREKVLLYGVRTSP